MDNKNFPTHESGTRFSDGDEVYTHAGNSELISPDELERRRRRVAFEREALGVISPERRPLSPAEQLGQLHTVHLRRRHIERLNGGEFDIPA